VLPNKVKHHSTAVSAGLVLLARNPEHGIPRLLKTTYGFLSKVPYQSNLVGHRDVKAFLEPLEEGFLVEVIRNFLFKDRIYAQKERCKPITFTHLFPVDDLSLMCEEVLYVSDFATGTGYPLGHEDNRDARPVFNIFTDFTDLRDEGKIKPKNVNRGKKTKLKGMPRFEITYDLLCTVEERNLKFEARYPSGENGKVRKVAQICIASSFEPGTA